MEGISQRNLLFRRKKRRPSEENRRFACSHAGKVHEHRLIGSMAFSSGRKLDKCITDACVGRKDVARVVDYSTGQLGDWEEQRNR